MRTGLRICRGLEEVSEGFGPCVLSIGNFDGVHVAHRRILGRVVALAKERGWIPSALTFDPHPATIVAPHRAPRLLTTTEQRCSLMHGEGIQQVVVVRFDLPFSQLSPKEFVENVLVARLGVRAVLVGDNFRFGIQHSGNTDTLQELGARFGFLTEIAPAVVLRGTVISSSKVRELISAGDVSAAARALQRPHFVDGEVVRGQGIGSTKTVPTLNLDTVAEVLPADGVYVTRTRDLDRDRSWASATNIGYRPTFGGQTRTVETHLFASLDEPAPRRIRVEFLSRLRGERKFETAESLREQILSDAGRARNYFRRMERWVNPNFLSYGKAEIVPRLT